MIPYLKGAKLWPYMNGMKMKPAKTDVDALATGEEIDSQALSTILINIVPNVQAGLNCNSSKYAWDSLLSRYTQADSIMQNLAEYCLFSKKFIEGGSETLPAHLAELQWLRESCRVLGIVIPDSQFAGIITLSMPSPSWDLILGSLSSTLDPSIVMS